MRRGHRPATSSPPPETHSADEAENPDHGDGGEISNEIELKIRPRPIDQTAPLVIFFPETEDEIAGYYLREDGYAVHKKPKLLRGQDVFVPTPVFKEVENGAADRSSSQFDRPKHYIREPKTAVPDFYGVVEYDLDDDDADFVQGLNNVLGNSKKKRKKITESEFEACMDFLEKEYFFKQKAPNALPVVFEKGHLAVDAKLHVCDVCNSADTAKGNALIWCSSCGTVVHQHCYGIGNLNRPTAWKCDKCSSASPASVVCSLCPVKSGALKCAESGLWYHVACASACRIAFHRLEEAQKLHKLQLQQQQQALQLQLQAMAELQVKPEKAPRGRPSKKKQAAEPVTTANNNAPPKPTPEPSPPSRQQKSKPPPPPPVPEKKSPTRSPTPQKRQEKKAQPKNKKKNDEADDHAALVRKIEAEEAAHRIRTGARCCLCNREQGCCVRCCEDDCERMYHITCAMRYGLHVTTADEEVVQVLPSEPSSPPPSKKPKTEPKSKAKPKSKSNPKTSPSSKSTKIAAVEGDDDPMDVDVDVVEVDAPKNGPAPLLQVLHRTFKTKCRLHSITAEVLDGNKDHVLVHKSIGDSARQRVVSALSKAKRGPVGLDPEVAELIFRYWMMKRDTTGHELVVRLQMLAEDQAKIDETEQKLTKMEAARDAMLKLRQSFERLRLLVDLCKRREILKRQKIDVLLEALDALPDAREKRLAGQPVFNARLSTGGTLGAPGSSSPSKKRKEPTPKPKKPVTKPTPSIATTPLASPSKKSKTSPVKSPTKTPKIDASSTPSKAPHLVKTETSKKSMPAPVISSPKKISPRPVSPNPLTLLRGPLPPRSPDSKSPPSSPIRAPAPKTPSKTSVSSPSRSSISNKPPATAPRVAKEEGKEVKERPERSSAVKAVARTLKLDQKQDARPNGNGSARPTSPPASPRGVKNAAGGTKFGTPKVQLRHRSR